MCNATRSNANNLLCTSLLHLRFFTALAGNRGVWGTWGPRSQAVWGTAEPVARSLSRRPRRPQVERKPVADRKGHGRYGKALTPHVPNAAPPASSPAPRRGGHRVAPQPRLRVACGERGCPRRPIPPRAKERDLAFCSAAVSGGTALWRFPGGG